MHLLLLQLCLFAVCCNCLLPSQLRLCRAKVRAKISPALSCISSGISKQANSDYILERIEQEFLSRDKMGGRRQPFLGALFCLILDVMHLLRTILVDSTKWLVSLATNKKRILSKYYGGKTILITGASSGLGEQLALELMKLSKEEGGPINLVLSARSQPKLRAVAENCLRVSPSSKVIVAPLDLSTLREQKNVDEYTQFLRGKLKEMGIAGVDCVINNAGVSSRGAALETEQSSLELVMQINFFGPVALTKALLPEMIARGTGGAIVMISSVQGRLGIPFRTSYAASKHAIQGYCDCLRGELSKDHISLTVISPGYINTALSLNAVTADGKKYGVTDETTKRAWTQLTQPERHLWPSPRA